VRHVRSEGTLLAANEVIEGPRGTAPNGEVGSVALGLRGSACATTTGQSIHRRPRTEFRRVKGASCMQQAGIAMSHE
jgi:hypothetical protein